MGNHICPPASQVERKPSTWQVQPGQKPSLQCLHLGSHCPYCFILLTESQAESLLLICTGDKRPRGMKFAIIDNGEPAMELF